MGLIAGIKNAAQKKEALMSENFYESINTWKKIYQGAAADWSNVTYQTVGGQRTRKRATLGLGKVVASEMANLVFNENCTVNVSDPDYNEQIQAILKRNGFAEKFQDHLEYMFALGGSAIEVYADESGPRFDYVTADAFIPIGSDGRQINEGIFIRETFKGGKKYTRLRYHVWERDEAGARVYVIRNELYEADNHNEMGVKISLARLYPELKEETRIYNVRRPLFVYIKPNTANNIDIKSDLGISVFANSIDTIRALDIAFDSFEREFILGKKRVMVPASAVRTTMDTESGKMVRYFDTNDETYQAFRFEEGENAQFKDLTLEIRVEEHISAINSLLHILAIQNGFSAGAFSFDGSGLKTATEVISENSKTFRTRAGHVKLVEAGIVELIDTIGMVGELYKQFKPPAAYDVSVNFDDSIAEDRSTNAAYWIMLHGSNVGIPKSLVLQKVLKVTKDKALEMIKEAAAEAQMISGEDVDLFGMITTPPAAPTDPAGAATDTGG